MTINDTWGYKSYDDHWKSTETLIFNLMRHRQQGRQLPAQRRPDRRRPDSRAQRRAAGRGRQMDEGQRRGHLRQPIPLASARNTARPPRPRTATATSRQPSPARTGAAPPSPARSTSTIFKWPGEKFVLPEVKGKVTKAYLLADKDKALAVAQEDAKVTITLPANRAG